MTEQTTTEAVCANCFYSKVIPTIDGEVLRCRLYPPVRQSNGVCKQADTEPSEWCGHWQPNDELRAKMTAEMSARPTRTYRTMS